MRWRLISLFLAFSILVYEAVSAQNRQLVPSMRPGPVGANVQVPDYGELLINFQNELKMWADIKCQRNLKSILRDKIDSVRATSNIKSVFLVIANITNKTDCTISTFRPIFPNESPAVISTPDNRFLIYTVEVYPYIIVNGRQY